MPQPRRVLACLLSLLALLLAAPHATAAEAAGGEQRLDATIRTTEFGVPHISARSFAGAGYGVGYAQARDALCVLADAYLTVDAERSRFLGPDATWDGNSSETAPNPVANLAGDLYFRRLIDRGEIDRQVAQPAPQGPRREARELVRGFVAGYNRRVAEVDVDTIADPACRGADWVRPITEATAWRYLHLTATLASTSTLLNAIAAAQPPAETATATAAAPVPADAVERAQAGLDLGVGSNGIAIGAEGTANGRGVLLTNPHFPWNGRLRFWQLHLTVPGRMDASGVALLGAPLVVIGHTRGVAWTQTVSPARRFTPYQLTLQPGSPTTYLVDGRPEAMTADPVTVTVRGDDGALSEVTRTLYGTRYGPVVTGAAGLPLPWTATQAHAVRDANAQNLRFVNTWLDFGRARSVGDIARGLARTQALPWVTTVAADRHGEALYADVSVVPHVTDELAARCNTPLGAAIFGATGLPVLDGARSDCAWGDDPDSVQQGTFGAARMPVQVREDYLLNSNGSAWLSNADAPLTGFPRIVGDVATPRSLRTRMAHTAVAERLAGTDGLPGRGFDRALGEQVVLSDRGLAPELVADEVVAMCAELTADLAGACGVLERWDRRYDLDSHGAVLFSRFWQRALTVPGGPWTVPFDPADPVGTPRGLAAERPEVRQALADAVRDLAAAGTPIDAAPPAVQTFFGVPLHGGPESDGVLNKITTVRAPGGRPTVRSGSSFIQVVAFDGDGCPDARSVLTYSQSPDPTSPHHADQTALYSAKRWVTGRFCAPEITASPVLETIHLTERNS